LVKELYDELMKDFFEYIIPRKYFGPYQEVDYEGIGQSGLENVDEAEWNINVIGVQKM
jgi:hypothetical protein